MDYLLFIGIFFVTIIISLFLIKKWIDDLQAKSKPSDELVEWLKEMGRRVETSTTSVDRRLAENLKVFTTRIDQASILMSQVQKNIGEFSEIGRSMKDLQQLLQSPKLRGNIGEHILADLLSQFLPKEAYALQHTFKNGERVDAIIKTSQGFISIDAKFPLENFRKGLSEEMAKNRELFKREFAKDVKRHISDISKKYILTDEGTVDYALMYIPSESVFYEIITNGELCDYASLKRVLTVSPVSFYAYLKVVLMSYEGQKIEKRAQEILSLLQAMQKDYEKTEEAMSVLNRHLTNAYNQVNNVSRFFTSLGQKISSTHLLKKGEEIKKEAKEIEQKSLL